MRKEINMSKIGKEFKEFINKGNVMNLAVGMIIGAAFTAIVKSLVDDIIMPVIGLLFGKVDFTNLFVTLDGSKYATLAEAKEAGAAVLAYGSFIMAIINFLLIAVVVFCLVKAVNKAQESVKKEEKEEEKPAAPPEPSAEEKLLTEIRDLLKK